MEALTKLAEKYNLQLHENDRLFHNKYLYRFEVYVYKYDFPEILRVPTVDTWGYKVDSDNAISFVGSIRNFAKSQGDRTRREQCSLYYYTNEPKNLEKVIKFASGFNDLCEKHDQALQLVGIWYCTADFEKDVRYRKKRLPHGKYRYQLLGEWMSSEEYADWVSWAEQYEGRIKLPSDQYLLKYGPYKGQAIGYVDDDKMLQLVRFKLGSKMKKTIEYKIKEDKKNDD